MTAIALTHEPKIYDITRNLSTAEAIVDFLPEHLYDERVSSIRPLGETEARHRVQVMY